MFLRFLSMKEKQLMNASGQSALNGASGFTLMEVLVTVVILSIGLLGVAGLQFGSLRGNQSAFQSSIAATLAAEGADRLRANVPGVRDRVTGALGHAYDELNAAGADPACITSGCSVAEVAQHDAYEWITSIETQLPGGQGVICRDSTPFDGTGSANADNGCDGDTVSGIFAVKVFWDHDHGALDNGGNPTPLMAYRVSLIP
jgi:type IV pilus assembly protein PilV